MMDPVSVTVDEMHSVTVDGMQMSPHIIIPKLMYLQMATHCRLMYPEEACGILGGKRTGNEWKADSIYTVENVQHSQGHFVMDPIALYRVMMALRAEGKDMVALFHSHPHWIAVPSGIDIAHAVYDTVYIIFSFINPRDHKSAGFLIDRPRNSFSTVGMMIDNGPSPNVTVNTCSGGA